jgi:hypothetical protein
MVALGVDADGRKHPLGLWEGTTENKAVWSALLGNLIDRGLDASPSGVVRDRRGQGYRLGDQSRLRRARSGPAVPQAQGAQHDRICPRASRPSWPASSGRLRRRRTRLRPSGISGRFTYSHLGRLTSCLPQVEASLRALLTEARTAVRGTHPPRNPSLWFECACEGISESPDRRDSRVQATRSDDGGLRVHAGRTAGPGDARRDGGPDIDGGNVQRALAAPSDAGASLLRGSCTQ